MADPEAAAARGSFDARWEGVDRLALWVAALGGPMAWTLHLLAAYALGEFGCVGGLGQARFLGIQAVAWAVLAMTLPLAAAAAVAALFAYRCEQRLRAGTHRTRPGALPTEEAERTEAGPLFLARAGWMTSGLFFFIILFETVPVFFFLREC